MGSIVKRCLSSSWFVSSLWCKKYTQVSAEVKNETAICKKGDSIKLSAKEKKFFYIHTLLDNLSFYIQLALPADGIGNRYCLQALFLERRDYQSTSKEYFVSE